jgi:hypothetical protein
MIKHGDYTASLRRGVTRKHLATQIRNTVAKQSMVTVTYVPLVGERWLIKASSGKIARAANREKWLAETQR